MKGLSRLLPIIGGAVAGGAIALAVASGSTTTHSVTTTTVVQPSSSPALPTSFSNGKAQTINQIYKPVGPGVVDITTSSTQNTSGGSSASVSSSRPQGEGAGVVFDKKGDILTDQHVVSGASKSPSTSLTAPRRRRPSSAPTPAPTWPSSASRASRPPSFTRCRSATRAPCRSATA